MLAVAVPCDETSCAVYGAAAEDDESAGLGGRGGVAAPVVEALTSAMALICMIPSDICQVNLVKSTIGIFCLLVQSSLRRGRVIHVKAHAMCLRCLVVRSKDRAVLALHERARSIKDQDSSFGSTGRGDLHAFGLALDKFDLSTRRAYKTETVHRIPCQGEMVSELHTKQ